MNDIKTLRNLFPNLPVEFIQDALVKAAGNPDKAATALLDSSVPGHNHSEVKPAPKASTGPVTICSFFQPIMRFFSKGLMLSRALSGDTLQTAFNIKIVKHRIESSGWYEVHRSVKLTPSMYVLHSCQLNTDIPRTEPFDTETAI